MSPCLCVCSSLECGHIFFLHSTLIAQQYMATLKPLRNLDHVLKAWLQLCHLVLIVALVYIHMSLLCIVLCIETHSDLQYFQHVLQKKVLVKMKQGKLGKYDCKIMSPWKMERGHLGRASVSIQESAGPKQEGPLLLYCDLTPSL